MNDLLTPEQVARLLKTLDEAIIGLYAIAMILGLIFLAIVFK